MESKTDAAFDVVLRGDSFIIRVLKDPTMESQMYDFFKLHESKLNEIKTIKSTRLFFDIYELSSSLKTLTYIPQVLKHFLKMQPVSNMKLKACSVYVSNSYIASIIQPILDKYPGEVPTLISCDLEVCKQFLRDAK